MKYKKVMLPLLLFKGFWGESSDIVHVLIWKLLCVLWCVRAALECGLIAKLWLDLLVVLSFSFLKHEWGLLSFGVWRKARLSLHLLLHLSCNSRILSDLLSECLSLLEGLSVDKLGLINLFYEAFGPEVVKCLSQGLLVVLKLLQLGQLLLHLRELGQLHLNFSLFLSIKKLITCNFSSGSSSLWTCFH